MYRSEYEMSQAAGQLRNIAASLSNLADDLRGGGVWVGDDAERFQREWTDQVSNRLYAAANRLDNAQFTPVEE